MVPGGRYHCVTSGTLNIGPIVALNITYEEKAMSEANAQEKRVYALRTS